MCRDNDDDSERRRCLALWVCWSIFAVRAIGQAEVLILQPRWLPAFAAWESGFVPYALLLPVQICLLALMAATVADHRRGSGTLWPKTVLTRRRLERFACAYAFVMVVRLLVTAAIPPHTLLDRGLIPIVAHWDLALFLALCARAPGTCATPAPATR